MRFSLQTPSQLKAIVQGFRKEAGLTQAAMASALGITQQAYARLESNLHATSVDRLYTILRLLNAKIEVSHGEPSSYHEDRNLAAKSKGKRKAVSEVSKPHSVPGTNDWPKPRRRKLAAKKAPARVARLKDQTEW